MFVTKPNQSIKTVELLIPEHFKQLIADLRSDDINEYVEIKKNVNINYDNFSISSDDFFNMIQYDENESEFETMSSTTTGNTFGTTSNDD